MRSCFSPSIRPLLSIGSVQLFNLFRQVQRTDIDGKKRIQSPYQWRHGDNSVDIDSATCPMLGQVVTRVAPKLHQQAHDEILPRGKEYLFGFFELHGRIDNSAMLVPLEALLKGGSSVRPVRSKDWK